MFKRIDEFLFGTPEDDIEYSEWYKDVYYNVLLLSVLFIVTFIISVL